MTSLVRFLTLALMALMGHLFLSMIIQKAPALTTVIRKIHKIEIQN
jgi:hypothetical protein